VGKRIILPIKSETISSNPPRSSDSGISSICFNPKIVLNIFGTIRPIKPIIPDT